ncbi:MAG: acetyl-CoA carboxylase biotin carboxyl carrier protein [Acidimicrobiia bacterium]|nr:acetyl-CoA carboxylase biotin carboxyl carrier protein [Acidimicrobiia bacterium]
MDFDELTRILELMRDHELTELELERPDFKVRVKKGPTGHWVVQPSPAPPAHPVASSAAPAAGPPPTGDVGLPSGDELDLAVVKSPIVGTFYRAPSPETSAFAEVGQRVKKGQPLCIIEAMKLMNEINSDVDGEVVRVYVENGQPVQYGERLFAIRPA